MSVQTSTGPTAAPLDAQREFAAASVEDRLGIMGEVRMVGGAIVLLIISILVLNEVFNAVDIDTSSPWYDVVTALENTGGSALTLLVVALIVIAAVAIMRIMRSGGFGAGGGR